LRPCELRHRWQRGRACNLRTFVIVADAGGFARAAAHLSLSQSAASRQIFALEAELGVSLFDRIGRRILLTSEGEDLLARGRRLLTDVDGFSERARALKGGRIGTLRVSAAPQVMESVLAPFLPEYLLRHPSVDVRLIEGSGAQLHGQLERGEAHLALMPVTERFDSRLLYPIHVLAVLSRTHRLGRRSVIDISHLAGELLRPEFGSRPGFDSACDVARVDPRVVLECGAAHTLVALAHAGYGIAIVPSTTPILHSDVRGVPLVLYGSSVSRWSVVAWNPQRFLAPYAKQFVDELVAQVRRTYPGRDIIRCAPVLPESPRAEKRKLPKGTN
jgi:LysR family transcriptional regulator, cyn operon transcriptional activator